MMREVGPNEIFLATQLELELNCYYISIFLPRNGFRTLSALWRHDMDKTNVDGVSISFER